MDDPTTPTAAQTPASTGLPADLFGKAQAAATEKGRPIYVYRAERAGRYTSKWEPVEGATPAAVIEPLPAADSRASVPPPHEAGAAGATTTPLPARAPDQSSNAAPASRGGGHRVTLHAAGGQTETWEGVTDLAVEDGGRVVRFRDAEGAALRIIVGGGSISVLTPGGS
jgi:hypothetical protein